MPVEDIVAVIKVAITEATLAERDRLIRELTRQGVIWKDDKGNWLHVQPLPETARQIPYALKQIRNLD